MRLDNKIIILLIIIFLLPCFLSGQYSESTVKALLIEKIARFTHWPKNLNFEINQNVFIVGLFGKDPMGGDIGKTYRELSIRFNNKKIVFKKFKNIDDLRDVHILLISSVTNKVINKILEFYKNKPVLTISDSKGFAERGIHVNFFYVDEKVRFEINETAVHNSGLSMSYLLLRVAKIINKWEKK